MIGDHPFRPYADDPYLCVAELPASGDTCNQPRSEHIYARGDFHAIEKVAR